MKAAATINRRAFDWMDRLPGQMLGIASLTANLQMFNYRAQKLGLSTQPTVLVDTNK
jgi:hypothetical protein